MIPTTVANTFGAIEIGSFGAAFLFGIVTLQCYIYFSQNPNDSRKLKAMVAIIWVLECVHSVLIFWEVYRLTITYYGRAKEVRQYPGFSSVLMLGGFITMIVQCFFAYRVWKFLPRPYRFIGLACGVIAITRGIMSLYGSVEAILMTSYPAYLADYQHYLTALLALGAFIDVVNAASMSYFLVMQREKAFSKTTTLIDRLVAYTIGTGVITSVAAIAVLILFQTLSQRVIISLALYVALAKLYSNSLLSALNARRSLREGSSKSVSITHPRLAGTDSSGSSGTHPEMSNAISIEMKTTKLVSEDQTEDSFGSFETKTHLSPISETSPRRRPDDMV
ncbi:unnamed protein product [Cyclocybe aegerita]|uniref:DUF6534 domain-containing protein n=1 Tax=Cyclocybe aegerita TaxID=1973307 RepID=A0A8S0VZF8_CYCAE|nr:unnamed protein product [Cyclocybe aegerita]